MTAIFFANDTEANKVAREIAEQKVLINLLTIELVDADEEKVLELRVDLRHAWQRLDLLETRS